MSQYMSFFVRKGYVFCPIGTYSRSSTIYREFNDNLDVSYEKVMPLNDNQLSRVKESIKDRLNDLNASKEQYEKKRALIATCNNSLNEKLEAFEQFDEYIKDYEELVDEYNYVMNFVHFLHRIVDDVKYGEDNIDENHYLYVGIECAHPEFEDVID